MIKKEKCCPPSIAYANSADAPYIPSPKGRGFTALSIITFGLILHLGCRADEKSQPKMAGF